MTKISNFATIAALVSLIAIQTSLARESAKNRPTGTSSKAVTQESSEPLIWVWVTSLEIKLLGNGWVHYSNPKVEGASFVTPEVLTSELGFRSTEDSAFVLSLGPAPENPDPGLFMFALPHGQILPGEDYTLDFPERATWTDRILRLIDENPISGPNFDFGLPTFVSADDGIYIYQPLLNIHTGLEPVKVMGRHIVSLSANSTTPAEVN